MEEKQQSNGENGLKTSGSESSIVMCDGVLIPESGNVLMEMETSNQGDIALETTRTFGRDCDEHHDSFLDEDSNSEIESCHNMNSDNLGGTCSSIEINDQEEAVSLPVLKKPKPKHVFFALDAVNKRSLGWSNHMNIATQFNAKCYGSLRIVQRMELAHKMDSHDGCVNALHFNLSGSRLASGSDDLSIIVWNWAEQEPVFHYYSGHTGNVTQAKFLPLCGDKNIVSCARDGHIRIAELSSSGVHSTRRLGLHRGPAHKLALLPDTPHVFLTAGEDAAILEIDVRQSKPNKLITVKQAGRKISLYSIATHPIDPNEFCVGGRDQFIRIYDRRRITSKFDDPWRKFCPNHLNDPSVRAHVTAALYNFNGTELLASYNDEDIYSFSTINSSDEDFLHRYQGHRNSATVKGVNYFGLNSEFVVSGSDCGNIFFWESKSEAIVQLVSGDENGVVNCLETHPTVPVLATSGLDDEVKIWTPMCFDEPRLRDLNSTVKTNHREREEDRGREPDTLNGEALLILWRHVRRIDRRRRQQQQLANPSTQGAAENSSSSSDESDESEIYYTPRGIQCAPS